MLVTSRRRSECRHAIDILDFYILSIVTDIALNFLWIWNGAEQNCVDVVRSVLQDQSCCINGYPSFTSTLGLWETKLNLGDRFTLIPFRAID
jgi:hypothetical protein